MGRALPTPNRPHATGSLRSCQGAARRAGMRLTPAKAPGRKCEGCAAVRRIPARMVVSVTRTGRGRHYPADPSRVPVFHLAHFGTGTIDVGPAFSGRDRGRGEAAHGTCTRYLHVAAQCAWPTFPRTRLSPGLPGIRPPAPDPVGPAVRVAGSRGVSMRHGFAGGDKFAAASTFHRLPSGLTGGPIRPSDSHRPSGQAGGRAGVGAMFAADLSFRDLITESRAAHSCRAALPWTPRSGRGVTRRSGAGPLS